MHAFILAGGFATRLWPLTEKRAKPLLPLAGKPLLTHLLERIPEGMPVTVSTNAVFANDFEKWKQQTTHTPLSAPQCGEGPGVRSKQQTVTPPSPLNEAERSVRGGAGGGAINILIEDTDHEDRKLGALGAVRKWITEEGIDDDILLLAGDNYLGFDLQKLIDAFHNKITEPQPQPQPESTPLLAAHDIGDIERAKHFGTVIVDEMSNVQCPIRSDSMSDHKPKTIQPSSHPVPNTPIFQYSNTHHQQQANGLTFNGLTHNVTAFEEKPLHPRSTLISTGASIIPKQYLQMLAAYAKDHPDNIGGIFEHFLQRQIPVGCLAFAEPWFDIGSFDAYLEATKALIGNNVLKGSDVIDDRNTFDRSVILGSGSDVSDSRLTDCVLFGNCKIENCTIENCVIDTGCTLKGIDLSGKMLRSGTKLIRDS